MLPMPTSFSGPRPALAAALALAFLSPFAEAASPDAYDAAVAYTPGAVVLGNDGNAYRAAAEVKGSDPVTSADGAWRLAHVAADLVLDVPGRFESIADAWAFLEGARIAESATVAIELAPGTLEHDKPLVLNHAEGSRIVIRGAGDKPEDCVLKFGGAEGIIVSSGHAIVLEKLALTSSKKDGGANGLHLQQRATATLRDCLFDNSSCTATGGSHLTATSCDVRLARAGRGGFGVQNGATAELWKCTAVSERDAKLQGGFVAYAGGTMWCVACRAEGWQFGFKAYTNSTMHLQQCIAEDNSTGASAWFSSSVNVIDCVFASNAKVGIGAYYAIVSVIGSQLTANTIAAEIIGSGYMQFLEKPSSISGSQIGIQAKAGGRADLNGGVVFKDVATRLSVGKRPGDLPVEAAIINVE